MRSFSSLSFATAVPQVEVSAPEAELLFCAKTAQVREIGTVAWRDRCASVFPERHGSCEEQCGHSENDDGGGEDDIHAAELAPYCILPAQFGDSLFGGPDSSPKSACSSRSSRRGADLPAVRRVERNGAASLRGGGRLVRVGRCRRPFAFVAVCDSLGFDPISSAAVSGAGARSWKTRASEHGPFVVIATGRASGGAPP